MSAEQLSVERDYILSIETKMANKATKIRILHGTYENAIVTMLPRTVCTINYKH